MDNGKKTNEDGLQFQRITTALAEQHRLLLELRDNLAIARDIREELREQEYWFTDAKRES